MKRAQQRQPGDALPGPFIRGLRQKHGLTQEQLAHRLGIRGGKSVISAWETGATVCEGPAAELLLRLLGDTGAAAGMDLAALTTEADAVWGRAKDRILTWRQVAAVPDRPLSLERLKFANAFPSLSIPAKEHANGFPFVGLNSPVHGISQSGWTGVIPSAQQRQPHYFWTLRWGGEFLYREANWEENERSPTSGHIHIRSLLTVALATTFFLRRLAKYFEVDASANYTLALDLNGIAGRGIVTYHPAAPFDVVDDPPHLSTEDHLQVTMTVSVADVMNDPVAPGIRLINELTGILRPDLSSNSALRRELKLAIESDKRTSGKYRWLGFLENAKL